jgi:opacity protein-like surface antigen
MKKQLLITAAVGALVMGVSSAKAADIEPVADPASWYVSLFGGASWLDDVDLKYDYNDDNDYEANARTDVGFIIGGAVGTHLTDDLRVELEVAYSENDVDRIDYFDADDGSRDDYAASGKFGTLTFMANLWYDIPLSEELTPYIGGGAGLAIVDGKESYDDFFDGENIFDSSEVAFAFQVGAGLRWQVLENVALDVGYRLRGIDGPDFERNDDLTGASTSDYRADWMWSHNVIAGVSFGF